MTTQATATTAAESPTTVDERPARIPRWLTVVACLVVLAGLTVWFRYRAVGISSLWLDDAWVGVGAHFPSIGDTIGAGLSSPGFSLMYRGWATLFGTSATTAQVLALVFAIAAPLVLFLAATERGLPWYAGLLGGALLATAPAHIDMSTRFKQYTAEAFAATVVLWVAWRVIDRPGSARRWAAFSAVAIGAGLLSGIGALIAGTALGVCLIAAVLARPRSLRAAMVGTVAYGLVVGAWMVFAVQPNVHDKLANYWRGYYLDGSGFAGGLATRLDVVSQGFQAVNSTLVLVGLLIAAVIVLVRRPLVGLLLVSPTAVAVLLAALSITPLGTGRTDVYLFPSFALLVAVAVAELTAMVPAPRRWGIGVAALVVFAIVALAASPSFARGKPCPDPPVYAGTLMRCPYPQEDLTPLVEIAERKRKPGDEIVVYPSAGYAYGIATRYPIEKHRDARAATDWVVKVRGPHITVLRANRTHPERWNRPLDQITARSPRVWVIGTHIFPDWKKLTGMMLMRDYWPVAVYNRDGSQLALFVDRSPTAPEPRG